MPTPMRPIPDDFGEMLDNMGSQALARHYRAGASIIARWRREIGRVRNRGGIEARPMPHDFTLYAPICVNTDLCARYQASKTMVWRWRRESGIPSTVHKTGKPPEPACRPIPEGFDQVARYNSNAELARIYTAGRNTVAKWRKAVGITYIGHVKEPKVRIERERKPRKLPPSFIEKMGKPRQSIVPPSDTSIEGSAAQVLRAYAPVYRCDWRGRQDCPEIAKTHWRYGNAVLEPAEMMRRAGGKGWML